MNAHGNKVSGSSESNISAFIGDHDRFINKAKNLEMDFSSPKNRIEELTVEVREQSSFFESSGCISEESLFLSAHYNELHDNPDYQNALKAFGQLYAEWTDTIFRSQPSRQSHTTQLDSYDGQNFTHNTALSVSESAVSITDDEIEECAYLGWLRNSLAEDL